MSFQLRSPKKRIPVTSTNESAPDRAVPVVTVSSSSDESASSPVTRTHVGVAAEA